MSQLLNIPENVMLQHIFPCLDHNDLLRLRRVSKQTKALADAYLWTPKPGHQGTWTLRIYPSKENQSLHAFLKLRLPPPSRLYIANAAWRSPTERSSFFKYVQSEEFIDRYSKYITSLRLDKLFFPFTSTEELAFYESLVNLEELHCDKMITSGGVAQFEKKTRNAEGSFLMRSNFKKLKIFKLHETDCLNSMWNFINGFSNNLEELLHPMYVYKLGLPTRTRLTQTAKLADLRQLVERRRMVKGERRLVYDWKYIVQDTDPLERLRLFASCRDNGVLIKNLDAYYLDCLLCDETGRIVERREVLDPTTDKWIPSSLVKYQRNMFVGSVIHSLKSVSNNVFLMKMPALEAIRIDSGDFWESTPATRYPEWPNLRRMHIDVGMFSRRDLQFLDEGGLRLAKLEELALNNFDYLKTLKDIPVPRNLRNFCWNLKRLSISCCAGDNAFFLSMWEGLPLLEDVTLSECCKLTSEGFVGNGDRTSTTPSFLRLTKLKHLALESLEAMPGITDTTFKNVFRHLKLSSFKLTSWKAITWITIGGIKELLIERFAETIQKLDFRWLRLENVSKEELERVASSFRSSKML